MSIEIYPDLKCPDCENEGGFRKDDCGEVYCIHCGLVIESPYPYVAGVRFKTLTEILDEIEKEGDEDL